MEKCLASILRAPINYINDLRHMRTGSLTMSGTSFYPSFMVCIVFALLSMLGFAAYLIYYFITLDNTCYANVQVGTIILAALYPIESVVIWICLIGSAGTSTTKCWKFLIAFFIGLGTCGLGFGGLGIVFICVLDVEDDYDLYLSGTFLSNPTFVEVIVYLYLGFIVLYVIMMPILTYAYNSRNNKDAVTEATCMDTCCCFTYYFFEFIFFFTVLFMVCLKVVGPVVLVYDLIEVGRAHFSSGTNQTTLFALSIITLFGPIALFFIFYLLKCCCCPDNFEQVNTTKTENTERMTEKMTERMTERNSVFLVNAEGKAFEDKQYTIQNNKL